MIEWKENCSQKQVACVCLYVQLRAAPNALAKIYSCVVLNHSDDYRTRILIIPMLILSTKSTRQSILLTANKMKIHRTNMCFHFIRSNTRQVFTVLLSKSDTRFNFNLLGILGTQNQCLITFSIDIYLVSSNKNASPTNVKTHVIITILNLYCSFEIVVSIFFVRQIIWEILWNY